jgi:hypothetical protein
MAYSEIIFALSALRCATKILTCHIICLALTLKELIDVRVRA